MWTASVFVTTLSPASIIATWSAVSGAPGSHWVSRAPVRARAGRDVRQRAALAEHLRDRAVELVPGDDVRPADLERLVRGRRRVERAREVLGDVVDPDRLDALLARADHRHDRASTGPAS